MERRPRIGITCDVRTDRREMAFVFAEYVRRVEEAGGLPLAVPPLADASGIPQLLAEFEGFVIVGGEDLDPRLYGEDPLRTHEPIPHWRERFDIMLAESLLKSDHPVLGVCYGCQLLAVVSGGALWQHIPQQVGEAVRHAGKYPDLPTHDVDVLPGTKLRSLLGAERIRVNSAHHQAPKRLGPALVAAAVAPDRVTEAFEAKGDRFLFGVEWHPELLADESTRRLFAALVEAAGGQGSRRRAGASP
jgi:putative glutamine amidotransferase